MKNQAPEVFYEKGGLKNFAKFTTKHLCRNLFLIKLQVPGPCSTLEEVIPEKSKVGGVTFVLLTCAETAYLKSLLIGK